MSDLRKEFFKIMCVLAEKDEKVILLTGDLGFSFCEEYAQKFPNQFVNCGCIEQSMVGIAAGMARAGLKPYVYSNSIFLLSRANEFIRNDIAFQNLDVKLIGAKASGFLGFTHNFHSPSEEPENYIKGFRYMWNRYYELDREDRLRKALTGWDKTLYIKDKKIMNGLDGPLFIQI